MLGKRYNQCSEDICVALSLLGGGRLNILIHHTTVTLCEFGITGSLRHRVRCAA